MNEKNLGEMKHTYTERPVHRYLYQLYSWVKTGNQNVH